MATHIQSDFPLRKQIAIFETELERRKNQIPYSENDEVYRWKTQASEVLDVREMDSKHINACIRMLEDLLEREEASWSSFYNW